MLGTVRQQEALQATHARSARFALRRAYQAWSAALRILVVGEAPSKWMETHGVVEPLPLAGKELARMAGVRWPDQWLEMFEPVNVLDKWPGRAEHGKGDSFPHVEASRCATKLIREKVIGRHKVVLLGRRVATAFGGLAWANWFTWQQVPWFQVGCDGMHRGGHGVVMDIDKPDGTAVSEPCPPELHHHHDARCVRTQVAVAPHPSHVSRWWNVAENRRAADAFWSSMIGVAT